MTIEFPRYKTEWAKKQDINQPGQYHRYYGVHIKYIYNLFTYAKEHVELVDATSFKIRSHVGFEMRIDGKLVLVDFSDFQKTDFNKLQNYAAVFKFHYSDDFKNIKNIHPFSPVNFHDWDLFYKIKDSINYKAEGLILNNQNPAGAAVDRRNKVREVLSKQYGTNYDCSITSPEIFYKKVNDCLVSVCVPGARNDMLDRGQGQYMFLGACTISPKLVTVLSYNKDLIPGVHYVECKPDYSDLIEKIEWVRNNKAEAIKIGQNAKNLFLETSTPEKQIQWIKKCLNNE